MRTRLKFRSFITVVFILFFIIFMPILFSGGLANAQKEVASPYTHKEFIKEVAPTAQKLSKLYGIKSSIIIGQAALASHYGHTFVSNKYHNLFALRALPGQSGIRLQDREYSKGAWHKVSYRFLVYPSWKESLYDYLALLRGGKLWDSALYRTMATSNGYKTTARALQSSGFSDDPNYAEKLIAVIEENGLTDYDQ
ncbi:glycoside hydrolase family 73 protein [Streptococcus macacae]|uniref:Mannosyl-glycoprotein endo-beta-N-acetylglucosaminidase n=1 Tax=Streptococcus macacae NCTC 11558 TaxID=764298 RepID=G5JV69_9STRE|nr:glucosaminidase domain-containing protein [Streptococcus macacae]EHJ51527.1 mannosyl-glycoprotein endo-beta-N-acetylglucosaminidase [Streptococcus macacae NCTC 11558]SUN77694.1 N-acetyl-muramidase [Streptococcus macacae NCTC 11558]